MAISGNQVKAARALAGFDQKVLAERAEVGINTIRNLEAAGAANVRGRTETVDAIVAALKSAGVIFVEENGEGPGVRLRKRLPDPPYTLESFFAEVDGFERSRLAEVQRSLPPPKLATGLQIKRRSNGIDLFVGTNGPIGQVTLSDNGLTFDPDLSEGHDRTPSQWLTGNELARWARQACERAVKSGRGNIIEEADEGPGVWLNAEPAISDEAAVPEMPEGVAKDYDGSAM
jgi:hypothetical protein